MKFSKLGQDFEIVLRGQGSGDLRGELWMSIEWDARTAVEPSKD